MSKLIFIILLTNTIISQNRTNSELSALLAKLRKSSSVQNMRNSASQTYYNNIPKKRTGETSIENCNFKLNLREIFKTFPLNAVCKPMRMEFENGLNSVSQAVYSCIQKDENLGLELNFMIYIKSVSLMSFRGNRVKIFEAMSDPSQIYWKVSNSNEFLDLMDPADSLSCEMIKFGFSLLKR